MSLLKTMHTGASGLGAHAEAISVVSDNIANINTIGYKANRARFEDVLGSTLAGSVDNQAIGQGVRLGGVHASFAQGALIGSAITTDMAIQGDGFFVVKGAFDGTDEGQFYTRDGQFIVNTEGKLVNHRGLVVQGYKVDPASQQMSTALGDLDIPVTQILPPKTTTRVTVGANLSPSTDFMTFDPSDAEGTSHFTTSVTVYDSLGAAHDINIFFSQESSGVWKWNAMAKDDEMQIPLGEDPVIESGTLTFDSNGVLESSTQTGLSFQFSNASLMTLHFDFGSPVSGGGTGLDGTTQFDSTSTVSSIEQDGYGSGEMAGMKVEADGSLLATFTNGERRRIGVVALARFVNRDGLIRRDAGNWAESADSGQPLIGSAGNGGRGSIVGNTLEQSTVDIAKEFVNIISFQRGFQANSRTIRTADEMLSEAVNIKR